MLGKLLKYDFKYYFKILLPCYLILMVSSVFYRILYDIFDSIIRHTSSIPITITYTTFNLFVIFSLIFFGGFFYIIVIYRFYKNFFSSEGYLTHTLPISSEVLLLSKLISGTVVLIASYTVFVVAVSIYGKLDLFNAVGDFLKYNDFEWIFKIVINLLFFVIANVSAIYLAFIIGSCGAKKHKVAASIGIYYVINLVISLLYPAIFLSISNEWLWPLINIFIIVAAFFIGSYFMKTRLNLQ